MFWRLNGAVLSLSIILTRVRRHETERNRRWWDYCRFFNFSVLADLLRSTSWAQRQCDHPRKRRSPPSEVDEGEGFVVIEVVACGRAPIPVREHHSRSDRTIWVEGNWMSTYLVSTQSSTFMSTLSTGGTLQRRDPQVRRPRSGLSIRHIANCRPHTNPSTFSPFLTL